MLCLLTCHVASYVFVSECVTVMADHLSSSIHSISGNAIGEEGEAAIRAAAKETCTMIE